MFETAVSTLAKYLLRTGKNMNYLIGLLLAFASLTAGIIVLFQSVVLVSHEGLTLTAGSVMIASGLLMLLSIFLVWRVFHARKLAIKAA
jgi:hypothetical protein